MSWKQFLVWTKKWTTKDFLDFLELIDMWDSVEE